MTSGSCSDGTMMTSSPFFQSAGVAGFSAGSGYDRATGWGTVDLGLFVPAFLGQ